MDTTNELNVSPPVVYQHCQGDAKEFYPRCHDRTRKPRRTKETIKVGKTVYVLDWVEANKEFRRLYLKAALDLHDGNIAHTAKTLGIVRRTLQIQMRAAGISCIDRRK